MGVSCFPAPQKKLHELSQFSRRSFQVSCRSQIDERVSRRFRGISFVSRCQQSSVCIGERVVSIRNPHRPQERFADVLIEGFSCDLLDQVACNCISRVGIRHASSRRPACCLRFLKPLENFEQRKIVAIAQVVNFARFHVVESGGMLEEVHDSNGMHRFPAVLEGDFRRDILQAGIQIYSSFFL